jgi:hypothetical protein
MTNRLDSNVLRAYAAVPRSLEGGVSMGELDRDSRRRDDRALEEIRRLFERYRTIARNEARIAQMEPAETEPAEANEQLVPAGR